MNRGTSTRQVSGSLLYMGAVTYKLSKVIHAQTRAGTRPPPLLSLKFHDSQTERPNQEEKQAGGTWNLKINIERQKTEECIL